MSARQAAQGFYRGTERPQLVVSSECPRSRGLLRGEGLNAELQESLDRYLGFFRGAGLSDTSVREAASRVQDALEAWRPAILEEMQGIADGAGLEHWHVVALNARTEILAMSPRGNPGECTTLVRDSTSRSRSAGPYGIQTWDWTEELGNYWHTVRVTGTPKAYVSVTEHGILAKIGMNESGLGIFLNILGHKQDRAEHIPVHVIVAVLLSEAGSVAEAIDLLEDTQVSGSTALTLIDRERAACVELSPVGVRVLGPQHGSIVHTNHFLHPELTAGERVATHAQDSHDRFELVTRRLRDYDEPHDADDLLAFLMSQPGEPKLCCLPGPNDAAGQRWRTLATVQMAPEELSVRVLDGSPVDARSRAWIQLSPGSEGPPA